MTRVEREGGRGNGSFPEAEHTNRWVRGSELPYGDERREILVRSTKMSTDYTNAKTAPVLVCFIKYGDKFLLLKQSDKVLAYKNLWSCLAGFLDDAQPTGDKIAEEIKEELGLEKGNIKRITAGPVYSFRDEKLGREWIRNLYLVELSTPEIKLDWEHTDYRWISPDEIDNFETTPGLTKDLKKVKLLQ